MTPRIINIEAKDDFKLVLTYQGGEQRLFDAKPLFKYKMYAPLKNKGFFKLAKFDNMCVYWNDEIDIDPDFMYEVGKPITDTVI